MHMVDTTLRSLENSIYLVVLKDIYYYVLRCSREYLLDKFGCTKLFYVSVLGFLVNKL